MYRWKMKNKQSCTVGREMVGLAVECFTIGSIKEPMEVPGSNLTGQVGTFQKVVKYNMWSFQQKAYYLVISTWSTKEHLTSAHGKMHLLLKYFCLE